VTGIGAAVNAAAAAVASGQAEHVIVYRGLTEADDGRQSHGKGHFPPLLSAHGVLTPAQVCALRTQRMLEVDGVPRSALEALVQASYQHAQQNPAAVAYGRPSITTPTPGPVGPARASARPWSPGSGRRQNWRPGRPMSSRCTRTSAARPWRR
jgi:acetyl-CoA acetyltransferase